MSVRLCIVMDPIHTINIKKDTSYALLKAAQARNYELYYCTPQDLSLEKGEVFGTVAQLRILDTPTQWFALAPAQKIPLANFDTILLRKDPPFNMDYIYLTYLLEKVCAKGTRVINNPSSVRSANEKLYTMWFPQCCPETLVSMKMDELRAFVHEQKEAIIKPLDSMGGQSIFRASAHDPNLSVILETMTHRDSRLVMAQRFIPEIKAGDKRIIMINGTPIPYALARIPAAHDFRGNLAAGAQGQVQPLTERDFWICEQVGPKLRQAELYFVGLDVIGDYLTEINVTSPTGVQEIERSTSISITNQFFDFLEACPK